MQDMDQGFVNCPDLGLLTDMLENMDDDFLVRTFDPDILFSDPLLTCEAEADSCSEVPSLTDSLHEVSLENTSHCIRKRPTDTGGDAHSAPKRQRLSQGDLEEVFSLPFPEIPPVQPPSPSLPSSPACIIAVPKSLKSQMVSTLGLPPFIRLPHPAPAIILVPFTPPHRSSIPPLSPVNGTTAPVQPSSSPSGSLSDTSPVCLSPPSTEKSPVKESPVFLPPEIPQTSPIRESPVFLKPEMQQSVKDYIHETKAYVSQACDDLGDGLTMTSNYVETKVLQRDNVRSGKSTNKSLDKELDVMGETDREKCLISLKQIFERRQGSRSKSYNLLVGKAGMGKSTCIKKLCMDWSKDCIPQFDFVFFLDGRLLSITEPTHSLQTLLLSLSSFAPPCSDPDAVLAQILASPKRVLLIFDGFEDLRDFELLVQPLEKEKATCLQKDKRANMFTVRQLYSALLLRVLLPGCSLLLASRPRGSASFLLRRVDSILEVSGFSPSEVKTYVKGYFSAPDIQTSAINCLHKCSYLNLLCWNPGICRLVCLILQRQPDLDTLPRTLTGICFQVLRMRLDSALVSEEEAQSSEQLVEERDMCSKTPTRSKSQGRTRKRASRKTHKKHINRDGGENAVLSELSSLAWESVKSNSSKISNGVSVSPKTREAGIRSGILNAAQVGRRQRLSGVQNDKCNIDGNDTVHNTTDSEDVCGQEILSWANPFLQSYLAAVRLSLSSAALFKTLSFQIASKGRRRSQREELELTQRFAVGLLFQKESELLWLHPNNKKDTVICKQNTLMDHLRNLPFGHLIPSHILDLCHFVYEGSFTNGESTKDSGCSLLAAHLVDNFPEKLNFNGIPLNPADVYAVKNTVEHKGTKQRRFSLDVQDSGIQVSGLRSLVGLDAISAYRACIADVIVMWGELGKQDENDVLRDVVSKFKIEPFKATQVSHIEHLAKLVDIHMTKKLSESISNSIFAEGVPAVRDLHKLELELGPEKGPLALPMLWDMVPGLHNLQHMDLENNKIGDDGAEHFAEALISLSSLETLNLSQNSFGDHGVKALAAALKNLPRLERLSLHSNLISDEGACSLATVLPQMAALSELDIKYNKLTDVGAQRLGSSLKQCRHMKSLRMWSQCIPYGAFVRLQQQDHRITDI